VGPVRNWVERFVQVRDSLIVSLGESCWAVLAASGTHCTRVGVHSEGVGVVHEVRGFVQ